MSVKAQVEAIIYAAEEPVTLNQLVSLLRDSALAELSSNEQPASESDSTTPPEAVTAKAEASTDPQSDDRQPAGSDNNPQQPDQREKAETKKVKTYLSEILEELTKEYAGPEHGVEVRQIAGGYRMGTKPEHHDVVVGFAKSLQPPVRLSLQALETLAVIAYKQPVTVPEISEIRGVDCSGVMATLLQRKLITTAGRKQVIGRPILYKTTKEFLLRFGLNNVSELPSMEEFEKLGDAQAELLVPTGETSEPAAPPVASAHAGEESAPDPAQVSHSDRQ